MTQFNVPKGWALVPMEATPEMEQAVEKYWNERRFKSLSADPRTWQGVYAAMLAAAPAAPVARAEPVGEIVHWSNGGRTLKFVRMDFEAYPEGTKLYVEPVAHPDARALVEALAEIAAMEPEPGEPGSFMDDADFRYLKCLRKMQRIARAAIEVDMAAKGGGE